MQGNMFICKMVNTEQCTKNACLILLKPFCMHTEDLTSSLQNTPGNEVETSIAVLMTLYDVIVGIVIPFVLLVFLPCS